MIDSCVSAPFGKAVSLIRVPKLHTMASLGQRYAIFFFFLRILNEFIAKSVSSTGFIKHYTHAVTLFRTMQL